MPSPSPSLPPSSPPSFAGPDPVPSPEDRLRDVTVLVPEGARTDSLSAVAYYLIRDLLVTLELPPGAPIQEQTLMRRLDLGRTPVREALRRLADGGLVSIYARRGIVAAPVDVRDLAAVSEVRVELEGLAARLAAERATRADRAQAETLLTELGRLPDLGDERALIRLDQRVHHFVHRAAHNGYLHETLGEYLTLSLRLWFLGLDRVSRLDDAVREHQQLLGAIAAGDGSAAAEVARAHVTGFQRDIRRVLTAEV
jgi:DNA-binding GntR family transcriptional regulator